jgi:hypothetical protein
MASTVGVVLCGPSSSLRSQEGVGVLVGCWGLVAGEIRRVCLCVVCDCVCDCGCHHIILLSCTRDVVVNLA